MRIGILAELAGTTVPTVRYYEEIGLLRQAARQGGGQRTYDRSHSSGAAASSASRSTRCARCYC
jgi:DNA-binding transcriptional MerR regulator